MNHTPIAPETLTTYLYNRSDKKLQEFCESRLDDLFKMCKGHSAKRPPITDFPEVAQQLRQLQSNKEQFPWHGAVWALASKTLFAMLRDEWREREVRQLIEQVEYFRETLKQEVEP